LGVEPPETVSPAAEIRLAEPVDVDRAVPEEQERRQLRARCTEQAKAPLLWPGVRELVRKDDAILVRLDAQRGDESLAAPAHTVRPPALRREPPVRGFRVLDEHAALAPVGQLRPRLLLAVGKRQVDDVV